MAEFKESDVTLVASWEPGKGFVAGRYTITNASEARLVVFDVLYNTARNGTRTIDPEQAFRWLTPEGVYRVVKQVPEVPEGVLVEVPEMPYGRIVEPGASLAGAVLMPLPLDYHWAYPDFGAPAPEGTAVRALELVIGYAVVDAAIRARAHGPVDLGYYAIGFEWALPRQRLVAAAPVDVDLPMQALTKP